MANPTITELQQNTPMNSQKAYKEKVKAKIDQIDAHIDQFRAKIAQTEAEGHIKYNNVLEDLIQKCDHTKAKFDELQASSESAWDDVRQGFESSWEELDQSFKKALSNF